MIRTILADPEAPKAVVKYAEAEHPDDRLDISPLLVDLFRYFKPAEALDYYINVLREDPEDASDDIVQALLPFGDKALDPLIKLYEELGEEQGSDIAFVIAGLRIRDPRVLKLLLDRLEYDAADGAFVLGLYGDPAARPALEKMLAEVPEEDAELRREIKYAIEQLDAPPTHYEQESFDILAEYRERELPQFDVLSDAERLELLKSDDTATRAGAAHSFFNADLDPKTRAALLEVAKLDAEAIVRAKAWESLADSSNDDAVRGAMLAVLNDAARPIEERGGAAVGLYAVADRDDVRQAYEALYEIPMGRPKALEAMWRSLWQPYSKYFPQHLDDKDPALVQEALRGTGYFRLTQYADKIAKYFDAEEPFDRLREDALFAYALAMPGETTRGRVKGMLRKIDSITPLSDIEKELVEFALDERLRLSGLQPVFAAEQEHDHDHDHDHDHHHDHEHHHHEHAAQPVEAAKKVGRNDPCPCGSGKKYKKCHGA